MCLQVSFELGFWRSIHCTCVDPRPIKLSRKQLKAIRSACGPLEVKLDGQSECAEMASIVELFDEFGFVERHRSLFNGCSIIVGMHPGEPTTTRVFE